MEYILTCSCHNQQKTALEAFHKMFPDKPFPEVVKGRDRIYKLSREINNEHIKAISKITGRYAYYLVLDEHDIIKEEYDLLLGRRIT